MNELAICEVDNINEILNENKFKQINDELKTQGFEKIALNLSEIKDDEFISIKYNQNSFAYQLPFTVNLEKTEKQIGNNEIISKTDKKIELKNMTVFENGLITGHDLKTYEIALNSFMEILPKIRRNIYR